MELGKTRGARDRGNKNRHSKPASPKPKAAVRHVHHPLFGEIPLVPVTRIGAEGKAYPGWDYDPDYQPPLPPGGVRGDVRRQEFCPMCHTPRYFYLDQDRLCVQCGKPFIFSAAEQKYWYETLKFHYDATAVRCPECRRRRRTEKMLRNQIAEAKRGLAERPGDPACLLALAQALAEYHRRTGQGNLDEAIAACRKAIELWPDACEALYWEAECQRLAGRETKAGELFASFAEQAPRTQRMRPLIREAEAFLDCKPLTPRHDDDNCSSAPR